MQLVSSSLCASPPRTTPTRAYGFILALIFLLTFSAQLPAQEAPRQLTEAERILNIRRLLDSDRKQKAKYETQQADLERDFEQAASEFEQFDSRLVAARALLADATDDAARAAHTQTVQTLEKQRLEARDSFELLIQRRKALSQQIATLTEKLLVEQDYMGRLLSAGMSAPPSTPPAPTPSQTPASNSTDPSTPPTSPAAQTSSIPMMPSFAPAAAPAAKQDLDEILPDEDMLQAERDRRAAQAVLHDAEERVTRLTRAVEVFERDLVSSRQLLELAQKHVSAEEKTIKTLEDQLKERQLAGAGEDELARLNIPLEEARQKLLRDREELADQTDRVAKSEALLERLKKSKADATKAVPDRLADLRSSERRIWFLSSPVAPSRLSWWFVNKGPRVVAVIVVALLMYGATRLAGGRLLGKVVQRTGRGGAVDRQSRAETLRRVFSSTAAVTIVVLGLLAALNQAGINVTVLLGGAAVIGAAIAFGSQNLIKDYFSGFMILMENQYSVGNVIKVGAITGTVEDITLRMTALRDLEGVLHFVPHSQVLSVSNLTHGWSRIVMDIRVNAAEDADRVMTTLMEVANEIREDRHFGPQILGQPEMLGVDNLANSGMLIKLLVKTKPLNRWPIKREMLRRIKKRFDEVGIKFS